MSLTREQLAGRVRQAIDAAQVTHADLASRIGMDPTALSKSLSGKRDFKSLEIAAVAAQIDVPVHHLLVDTPLARPKIAARLQPATSVAVEKAEEHVAGLLDLDEILADADVPAESVLPLDVPHRSDHPVVQANELAGVVRARLGLAREDPLPRELSELAERLELALGVDVAFVSLPDGLDGVSVLRGQFGLAVVNSQTTRTRQRYTLLHEIGHLATGDSQQDASALLVDANIYGRREAQETRANAFAAAVLMTAESLHAMVARRPLDEEATVADLRDRFQVSLQALAFRLHNLGLVNAEGRDRILRMPPARQTLFALQERLEQRAPGRLLARAAGAYLTGAVSIRPLASLLGVPEDALLDRLTPPAERDHDDATDAMARLTEADPAV